MSAQKIDIEAIKQKHGWELLTWARNLVELGKCMDDIESRLIREGKLKIVKGRYVRLNPETGKPIKQTGQTS